MTEGGAYVDESMITGEPSPALKQKGARVLAGTVVSQGKFRFKAQQIGEQTALAQIIKMVQEAQGSKAPVQRVVDRVARVFVPAVALIALVTFLLWWLVEMRLFRKPFSRPWPCWLLLVPVPWA